MEKETVSITFNVNVNPDNRKWIEWYNDAKGIINLLGYKPTHVGINSSTLHTGKVMTLNRYERKVISSIENGEKIENISMLSLPENFETAGFDYDVYILRDYDYMTLIANKTDFYNVNEDILVQILKKYADNEKGEIYEMNRYDFPLAYASKANPASFFKSLKILKEV